MTRRLIAATASAVLILGLAACDDGKGPVTTPPPDLGFEPQTSDGGGDESGASDGGGDAGASDGGGDGETQAAPDIPAPDRADFPGMDEHTDHGAIQAFKYYMATAMWAHQVGDDSLTQEMQTKDCNGCDDFMKTYRDLKEHNILWSEFSLKDVMSETVNSDKYEIQVNYNFTTTPHRRPAEGFKEMADTGELEYATGGGMAWIGGQWKVAGIRAMWGRNVLDD